MIKIDIHAHVVERDYLEDLRALLNLEAEKTADGKTLLRHRGFTVVWSREDMFDVDHRLREMDRKEIDMRVLSLSTPSVYPWRGQKQIEVARAGNDSLARLCNRHPDRFVGLATLPLSDVDAALVELDRALALGLKGAAIGSNIDGVPLNDARFEPLWARLDANRLPVFEHPMFPRDTSDLNEFELPLRVGLIFDTTLAAARMIYGGVFERYPNFPYVMAHTGGALLMMLERLDNGYRLFPDCRKYITRLPSAYAKQLYYDTTSFAEPSLTLALRSIGADHLLFGTDDPFIDADTGHVDRLDLPGSDKAKIFGANAAAILGLGATEKHGA
jgi:aminocarboxymuconate-semialdehyde decarboxylase